MLQHGCAMVSWFFNSYILYWILLWFLFANIFMCNGDCFWYGRILPCNRCHKSFYGPYQCLLFLVIILCVILCNKNGQTPTLIHFISNWRYPPWISSEYSVILAGRRWYAVHYCQMLSRNYLCPFLSRLCHNSSTFKISNTI